MNNNQKNNHFIVVEEGDGSLDIRVPSLFNDKERGEILRIILLKRTAIKRVHVDAESNEVKIRFDMLALPKKELFAVLNIVLDNFSEKPIEKSNDLKPVSVNNEGIVRRVEFGVEGMSCPSCALYIEMTLARDSSVISATVDYKSKKGMVVGFLEGGRIVDIIDNHGYKARVYKEL